MGADSKIQGRRLRAGLGALSDHWGVLLVLLAALAACSPRVFRGISCGHDFDFHLVSWMEVRDSWSEGVFYPHWAQTPNWAAGEPRFVFYPPLTWMLGAALSHITGWTRVPGLLTFLCLAGTGLAVRAFAREFLPGATATLAGVLAAATPYALFTAYERSSFGELAAGVWIPLLLLFAWRQRRVPSAPSPLAAAPDGDGFSQWSRAFDGSAAPLAVVLAAVWITNAPAGVMASYLLAFAALAAALILRCWWPVLRASLAAVLGLGLAAFYLVPAAWEQRWVAIRQAVDVGMRIGDSWLFARHASPDMELHDQVLRIASAILIFTVVLALAGFAGCLLRRRLPRESRHFWLPLALLIPGILVLQLPFSGPMWHLLPKLEFLQFPWRWLLVLSTPYAVFLAAATPLGTRRARIWATVGWAAVLLVLVGFASSTFFQVCDEEDDAANQYSIFQAGTGVDGTDEYAPVGADNALVASSLPDACLVSDPKQVLGESDPGSDTQVAPVWYPEQGSCDDTFNAELWQEEHKRLNIDSDHEGFVILRLRRYPAWLVTVNGQTVEQPVNREDGLIDVPVPAGPSTIEVRWILTPDEAWGRRISVAALILLAALWIAEQRLKKRRETAVHLS